MIELSKERIEQILYEETAKKEELETILRSIYTRYMRLYERYFADIDALDDNKIAELGRYREETESLLKHYYMDIPGDICYKIEIFENEYGANLFGPGWQRYLLGKLEEFTENRDERENEEYIKAEFAKECRKDFYSEMNYIFREGFKTESQTDEKVMDGFTSLIFGESK